MPVVLFTSPSPFCLGWDCPRPGHVAGVISRLTPGSGRRKGCDLAERGYLAGAAVGVAAQELRLAVVTDRSPQAEHGGLGPRCDLASWKASVPLAEEHSARELDALLVFTGSPRSQRPGWPDGVRSRVAHGGGVFPLAAGHDCSPQRHLWSPPLYMAPQFGQEWIGLSARVPTWAVGACMMGTASR